MKKQFCKTMSYVMTAALLLGVSMPSSPAAAKKKAPKLSTKKVSISVGQKKTIKLKNGKKAVWKFLCKLCLYLKVDLGELTEYIPPNLESK